MTSLVAEHGCFSSLNTKSLIHGSMALFLFMIGTDLKNIASSHYQTYSNIQTYSNFQIYISFLLEEAIYSHYLYI